MKFTVCCQSCRRWLDGNICTLMWKWCWDLGLVNVQRKDILLFFWIPETINVHKCLLVCLLPADTTFEFMQFTSGPCVDWFVKMSWVPAYANVNVCMCVFVCMNKNVFELLSDVCRWKKVQWEILMSCKQFCWWTGSVFTVDVLFQACFCKSIRVNDCVTIRKAQINYCLHPKPDVFHFVTT